MKAKTWERKLREACQKAGVWQPAFGLLVEQLAGVLERRDEARRYYEENGGEVLIAQPGPRGDREEQNPALQLIGELDRDALAMLRELGLTPRSLRQIKGKLEPEAPAGTKDNVLAFVREKHGTRQTASRS